MVAGSNPVERANAKPEANASGFVKISTALEANIMETKHIFNLIEERKEELFGLLSSFIQINSENLETYGNEEELARYIYDICCDLGLESELYSPLEIEGFENHPDYIPGKNLENRYNVTARWIGSENIDQLMLMGHTDTVPIGDLSCWDKDPLSGEISDGKIWGRGACDDKNALAIVIFLIKLLKEQGFVPKKNLLFSAYVDEEYGGSHGALASVLKYPCPKILNIDGVENQIWHCGSGGQVVYYGFHTKEIVDSAKLGASALPIVMEEIEKFSNRRREELSNNRFYKGTIIPDTSLRYMDIHVGKNGNDLGKGVVSFVFYTDKTKTEIEAEFKELEHILRERLAPMGIVGDGFVPTTRFFHYVHCEPDSDDIKTMLAASIEATGKAPLVCGSCLSDLSVISKYGSDFAYGCGVGRDFSLPGGAHQPNEFIECDKLVEFTKTIAAYIMKILG